MTDQVNISGTDIKRKTVTVKDFLQKPHIDFYNQMNPSSYHSGGTTFQDADAGAVSFEYFLALDRAVKEKLETKTRHFPGDKGKKFIEAYSLKFAARSAYDRLSEIGGVTEVPYRNGLEIDFKYPDSDIIHHEVVKSFLNYAGRYADPRQKNGVLLSFLRRVENDCEIEMSRPDYDVMKDTARRLKVEVDGVKVQAKSPAEKSEEQLIKPLNLEEKVFFRDVGGQEHAKELLGEPVCLINNERYNRFAELTGRGFLFYGPPGTGKTLLAKAFACEIGWPLYEVNAAEILEPYVGVSEKNFQKILSIPHKAVVLIDEMDSLAGEQEKESSGGSRVKYELANMLSKAMSGTNPNKNLIFIGTTNYLDDIIGKLVRDGRFQKVHIDYPDRDALKQILGIHLSKIEKEMNERLYSNTDVDILSKALYARSEELFKSRGDKIVGSGVEMLIKNLVRRRAVECAKRGESNFIPLAQEDFLNAIKDYDFVIEKKCARRGENSQNSWQ